MTDSDEKRVTQKLRAWTAPRPTPRDTAQLFQRLQQTQSAPRASGQFFWLLVQMQFRVVRAEIWWGSLWLMLLGVLVTWAVHGSQTMFALFAPAIAASGVALLYSSAHDPAYELELTLPTSPRLLLLARLLLLFGFNLLLSLVGSAVLVLLRADFSLGALILLWLAPMAFLSALALCLTLFFPESLLGILVSWLLWSGQILQTVLQVDWFFLPRFFAADWQLWLWLGAGVLGVLAWWRVGRTESFIRAS